MFKKAFTLIEILIVMAIIGILAIGLIAALDPIEQLRRATDTGLKNSGYEAARAYDRYYATTAPTGGSYPACAIAADTPLTSLVNAGELKQVVTGLISGRNVGGKPLTCFAVTSKALKLDPLTKYGTLGSCGAAFATGACVNPGTPSSAGCTYWCDQ